MAGEHLLRESLFGIDRQVARAAWTVAVVALALYCIYTVRTTLLVVLIAVFFSYLVYPLFALLQRWLGPRVPRIAVLCLSFLIVLGALGLAGTVFGSPLSAEATTLAQQAPKLLEPGELARRLPLPAVLEPFRVRMAAMLHGLVMGGTAQALPVVRGLGTGLVHAAGNLIYLVIVPIFSFLMILEAPASGFVFSWLRARKNGDLWSSVVSGLNDLLARYVRTLALLSLATLLVYSIVLSLMGAPFALLLALLAALLEVIPVFGPLAGAVAIMAVAVFSGYEHLLWLLAFFVAYRIFQDYVLNPYLMSEGVNVPPILVVFGLLAGDELAGVPGIFLSIPVIAAIRIMLVQIRRHRTTSAGEGAAPSSG
jgi:predicted PurR-regulated permease PerM